MSELYQSLSHSRWNCKYHVVFVPKRRRKKLFGEIRRQLGPIFHELARQKECRIIEGHVMPDHVHMCIEVPPMPWHRSLGFSRAKVRLPSPASLGAMIAISRASTFGRVAMRSPRLALSWNKSKRISVTKIPVTMMVGFRLFE
jgi:Transposase IS200 like